MQLIYANATAPQKMRKKTPSKVAQRYSKKFRISEWDRAFWITVFESILLSSTFYFWYLLKEDYLSIHEANSLKHRQKDCLERKLKKQMLFPVFIHLVAFTSKNAFILRFYFFCYVIHVMLVTNLNWRNECCFRFSFIW